MLLLLGALFRGDAIISVFCLFCFCFVLFLFCFFVFSRPRQYSVLFNATRDMIVWQIIMKRKRKRPNPALPLCQVCGLTGSPWPNNNNCNSKCTAIMYFVQSCQKPPALDTEHNCLRHRTQLPSTLNTTTALHTEHNNCLGHRTQQLPWTPNTTAASGPDSRFSHHPHDRGVHGWQGTNPPGAPQTSNAGSQQGKRQPRHRIHDMTWLYGSFVFSETKDATRFTLVKAGGGFLHPGYPTTG